MRFDESDLLQDLLIFDVQLNGCDVHVDLYGGRENVCGSVRFTFPNSSERRRNLTQLRDWHRDSVPAALLSYGDTITLLSERALMERCLLTST